MAHSRQRDLGSNYIAGRAGQIDNQESTTYGDLRGDIQIFVERNFT
jgi:hypothetical protein